MAKRPIYIPEVDGDVFVRTIPVEFQWYPGMAPVQKQRSIVSLHEAALKRGLCSRALEVSSKSTIALGVQLSAFNLTVTTTRFQRTFTVEAAYQSSKVFEHGGPYKDLLYGLSKDAKKDPRLRESGHLLYFEFFGQRWELEPRTSFYDWLYINALHKNEEAVEALREFDAFTDIEFNPERSVNCQAYSVALYSSLERRGLIADAVSGTTRFLDVIRSMPVSSSSEDTERQPRLV